MTEEVKYVPGTKIPYLRETRDSGRPWHIDGKAVFPVVEYHTDDSPYVGAFSARGEVFVYDLTVEDLTKVRPSEVWTNVKDYPQLLDHTNPGTDSIVTGTLSEIDSVLAERGSRYGSFDEHARISQNLKAAMADSPNYATMAPDIREAFDMIVHKIARALNGDPEYTDNFVDIAGYAQLPLRRIEKEAA